MRCRRGSTSSARVTMASSVEGCVKVVEPARRSTALYMLAERRLPPDFDSWAELVRSGRLGRRWFYAEADYLHPIPTSSSTARPGNGTGGPIALLYTTARTPSGRSCMSREIGFVRAMAVGDGQRIMPGVGIGAIDIQVALFETARKMTIR